MINIDKLYLDTLKHVLTDYHREPTPARYCGEDWPLHAETMVGIRRLDNIRQLINTIVDDEIEGDVLEAGVWRGGASIFIKANLMVRNSGKRLFVCDSFEGLPRPKLIFDYGDTHHKIKYLKVSQELVENNFMRFGLLDERVIFVKGWFEDTMPHMRSNKFSLIRLDGDMYQSTLDVLNNIYDSVTPGGFIIIDDYALKNCRLAVSHFRQSRNISDTIHPIDNIGVYWRKS
jgi:O-methyltransferase